MVSQLMELEVVADNGDRQTAYMDVGGPLILTPGGKGRQDCTVLRTPAGEVVVHLPVRALRAIIHEHRGVR